MSVIAFVYLFVLLEITNEEAITAVAAYMRFEYQELAYLNYPGLKLAPFGSFCLQSRVKTEHVYR